MWDCPKCGRVAHRDETAARRASQTEDLNAPTPSPRTLAAGKTHWEMLLERRTEQELESSWPSASRSSALVDRHAVAC